MNVCIYMNNCTWHHAYTLEWTILFGTGEQQLPPKNSGTHTAKVVKKIMHNNQATCKGGKLSNPFYSLKKNLAKAKGGQTIFLSLKKFPNPSHKNKMVHPLIKNVLKWLHFLNIVSWSICKVYHNLNNTMIQKALCQSTNQTELILLDIL